MTGFILNVNGLVPNMTGVFPNPTGFVTNISKYILIMTGFVQKYDWMCPKFSSISHTCNWIGLKCDLIIP